MILYINACVRRESRTKLLADHLLGLIGGKAGEEVQELRLEEIRFPVADQAFLNRRDALISAGRFDDPLFAPARQFAAADTILIAAPFWDLSFPSMLKQYFGQINVTGITFEYRNDIPHGLCKAQRLYYVTTAGGEFFPEEYGFGYVKALAQNFYGIPEVELIKAKRLDLEGESVEEIMAECEREIVKRYKELRENTQVKPKPITLKKTQ